MHGSSHICSTTWCLSHHVVVLWVIRHRCVHVTTFLDSIPHPSTSIHCVPSIHSMSVFLLYEALRSRRGGSASSGVPKIHYALYCEMVGSTLYGSKLPVDWVEIQVRLPKITPSARSWGCHLRPYPWVGIGVSVAPSDSGWCTLFPFWFHFFVCIRRWQFGYLLGLGLFCFIIGLHCRFILGYFGFSSEPGDYV